MISCYHVSKSFVQGDETIEAASDVTLNIEKGSCVVLKGASGSGKSTLLSLIAGLVQPSSGKIAVAGKEISKLPEHLSARMRRENIGFIFQKYHLIPHLSVQENVILPLLPENLPLRVLESKAKAVMECYAIAHKAHIAINRLSGGEQQRVAIARALINEPSLVLADEPTANLDETLSQSLIEAFAALKAKGVTVVIATHDPLFFELPFVDSIIELRHGKRVP